MAENSQEIKIEHEEQIILQQHLDYPKEEVKIEVDPVQFPPVRWYPIDQFKLIPPEIMPEQLTTHQEQMKTFMDVLSVALLQVLTSEQSGEFLKNYSEFRSHRVYVLMVLSFAKWRSGGRIADFERTLAEGLSSHNIAPIDSIPPLSLLYKAMKACQLYLQGDPQRAVDELYQGSQESIYMNAISFAQILQKEVQQNKAPKPDFESQSSSEEENEDPNSEQVSDEGEKMDEEAEQQQYSHSDSAEAQRYEEPKNQAEGLKYQEPFLISQRDLQEQYLFPSDPTIKLKASFMGLLKK